MRKEQTEAGVALREMRNVLIIDDDKAFAERTSVALQSFGYRTKTAHNPRNGIALLATFPADVVLLDTRIGGHDGVELIVALRECSSKILCVLVSGDSDTQSAVRALRFGAFDYLTKPVDIEILDASLDRCFDRLKLEQEKECAERALAESEARFRSVSKNTMVSMSIKERKKSEHAPAQNEELLRSFIDNSDATMTLKDPGGRYLLVNETFKRLQGRDDVIGKTFFELGGQTDAENMSKVDHLVMKTGEIKKGHDLVFYANGESWQRRFTKFPVYDSQGELVGVGTIGNDIKEHLEAEEKQRESEARLRAIIDGIPYPISLKGLDRRFIVVNAAFEGMFDVPSQQIIGRTAEFLWRDVDTAAIDDHERSVIEEGKPRSDERTDVLSSGKTVHNIATKFPIFDSNRNVALIGTMLTDISERKTAEEAVRKSEQQLRLIIDSLPLSIGYFSADCRYVLANKTNAQWHNSRPEMLVGKTFKDAKQTPYPGFEKHIEQTLKGKELSIETTATYPDNVTRDVQVTNVPDIAPDGRVRGFFGMAQDITARKHVERQHIEIEERFRAVIDNSPAAIVLKDADGRYLMVNKTHREWLRVHRDTDCTGKTVYDFFPKETADKVTNHERLVVANGESFVQERNSTFPDGVTRVTWSHKFPIFGPGGECKAVGTVNLDVTEQRNLQAQLSQAQKMEAVGQLTGGVAHDFNNLLGVIVGNLDFLADEVRDDPELTAMVEPAMKAAMSGANLTRQLLAFSRKQPLTPQVIDVNQHISDMTEMLRRTLGKSIEITMNLDEKQRPTEVDPTQLESVLLNLAVNARHAMPDGGALTIASSLFVLDEAYAARRADVSPGDYTLLTVTDTGTGMTPEILDQVFDPFFTTKGVGQGSGLGLSMAFGFAKQSGGHIEIESECGVGTTVKLYLPNATLPVPAPPPPARETPVSLGEKILVVEDEPEMLAFATTLLENLGYNVIEATNGMNALSVLETETDIDLLLTDIVMPGELNGLALAKKTQEAYPGLKVLFMSGYAADAIEIEGAEGLGTNLLRKPFRVSEMAETLRSVLDQ